MTILSSTSRFVVAAAAGLFAGNLVLTPAQAADLGSDCCADLEERIAELEATTVRKGNRKMSVKLSGQVNRALLFWDDGDESNVYVVDNDISSSRFRITGEADWKPGWEIGFNLEWEQHDDGSDEVNANSGDDDAGLENRQAHWWVRSDSYGQLSVGRLSTASYEASEENLSEGDVAGGSAMNDLWSGFALNNNGVQATPTGFRSELEWGDLNPGNMEGLSRQHGVRYDTPEFAGFTLSAGWYEDDMWDVALYFEKQWNSVEFAAAVGYAEDKEGGGIGFCSSEAPVNPLNGGGSPADCSQVSGSASILHQPTGLFATFAAGQAKDDSRNDFAALVSGGAIGAGTGVSVDDEASFWYANAGIYRRFNQHGKTSIGFEYYEGECGFGTCAGEGALGATDATFFGAAATDFYAGSESRTWGLFAVQHIDAAATEFYLSYHHTEGEVDLIDATGQPVPASSFSDLDIFLAGARVKF